MLVADFKTERARSTSPPFEKHEDSDRSENADGVCNCIKDICGTTWNEQLMILVYEAVYAAKGDGEGGTPWPPACIGKGEVQ